MTGVATSLRCVCDGTQFASLFTYTAPPPGETRFPFSASSSYEREIWKCQQCGHAVSIHEMSAGGLYTGEYVRTTYGDQEGLRRAFERITSLDPRQSDNAGRVARFLAFAEPHFGGGPRKTPTLLDVGSGLCVFLHRMKAAGWDGTALDPDPRAVRHAQDVVGVRAVCGDFLRQPPELGMFDAVSFNKVLEHVNDPGSMLAKAVRYVHPHGLVYVEVPDGEMAALAGTTREEFFIDHWHIFSMASLAILAARAGFSVRALERVHEPSGKYTLRAFLVPAPERRP